ncbi:MAG: hypothetical protein ILP19_08470 [Oscillospiraceae bacterium]|nr:hypothetical protein [Oscillospiraceae bacterium]
MRTRYRSDHALMTIAVSFSIIGIIVLIALVMQIREWSDTRSRAVSVTAQTADIVASNGSYDVYVTYTYDSEEYKAVLDRYYEKRAHGKTVDIMIDPRDPAHPAVPPVENIAVIAVFAAIFCAFGAGIGIRELRKAVAVNRLIDRDLYVVCTEWREEMAGVRVNRVRYRCIRAFYDNGNERYSFVSNAYHPNRCPLMPGESVAVYVDIENAPKTYYVDLER